jgi:hypothetical protein
MHRREEKYAEVLIRKPEGKRHICKELSTYRRVILKWASKK